MTGKRIPQPGLPVSMCDPASALSLRVTLVSDAVDRQRPGSKQEMRRLQRDLREECRYYDRCRQESWCAGCQSGQADDSQPYRGSLCYGCIVFTGQVPKGYGRAAAGSAPAAVESTDSGASESGEQSNQQSVHLSPEGGQS